MSKKTTRCDLAERLRELEASANVPWSAIDTDSRQAENKAIAERELGLVLRNWLPTILAALDQSEAMREENEKLRADLTRFEADTICEGCSAPLYYDTDDFVSDPAGVSGCWHTMTDLPSKRERPCYAYRMGKPDARQALEPTHAKD